MKTEQGTFHGHDGIRLFRQSWWPDGKTLAHVAVVHGIGEHSGRYLGMAEWFTPQGLAVHSFDLRGHGHSDGPRGDIHTWCNYREDTRQFILDVTQRIGQAPLFLLGHSMGGLIVLSYALNYSDFLRGVIASSPALKTGGVSPVLQALLPILARLAPHKAVETQLNAALLSHDAEVVKAYVEDPLVHKLATPALGYGMRRAARLVLTNADKWPTTLPLLLIQGGADHICLPEGTRRFFAACSAQDKMYREYPGYYHECFNEVGREQPLQDVVTWIHKHLDQAG